jgi:glycosyltransferase involved in cell wall biosynthesis
VSPSKPLVSVICLCFNQGRFVADAILSVLSQTYANVELIVTDDGSTDNSREIIQQLIKNNPSIRFLSLRENIGNCKAFNKGLALAKGDFIIDLAADDLLHPERIEKGLQALQDAGSEYGVNFSDAEWISETGTRLRFHSERYPHNNIPQGNIYKNLITKFFICPPSMMFSREVMDYLGGYDENLSYEDFDFWIRSSRRFSYCYTPEVLVKKRVVKNSLSEKQFRRSSPQLHTTYLVCKKIMALNQTKEEKRALNKRIYYELILSLRLRDFLLAAKYLLLLSRNISSRVKPVV